MSIKMLMFDCCDYEVEFLKKNLPESFEVETYNEPLNVEIIEKLSEQTRLDAVVICVFMNSNVTKEVIAKFPNLRIIATRSSAYNHIDLEACKSRNINVLNVDQFAKSTVIQYILALILNLTRKIKLASEDFQAGNIDFSKYVGNNLSDLTVGILGFDAVGIELCRLLNFFNTKILVYDNYEREELTLSLNVEYKSFEELVKLSDVLVINLYLDDSTYHLFDKKTFNLMKNSAYLINTSRGEIINVPDLYQAIVSEKIAGVALDLSECEWLNFYSKDLKSELINESKYCFEVSEVLKKLSKLPNVIITSNIAYRSEDALAKTIDVTISSIKDVILGGHDNQVC